MTGRQCVAARGLIGWPQGQLAQAAGVDVTTLSNFEVGVTNQPHRKTLDRLRACLEQAGIVFIHDKGVSLK